MSQTPPMKLDHKVVLITGGNGALGHAVIEAFVQAGARVFSIDRRPSGQVGDQTVLVADVTDEQDVRRLVNEVLQETGHIDALVNLVGGFESGRVIETDLLMWQRMLTLNLTSAFLLSKAMLPSMLERRSGRIIHIAARAAGEPFAGAAAYVVAKSGLVALIRALALELKGSGVTINGILPRTIDTPANRKNMPESDPNEWASPQSIAQALIFLASDESDQISGALVPVGA